MKNTTTETKINSPVVKRSVKHVFTPEEMRQLNQDFVQSYSTLRGVEADIDSQKALWKSKLSEAEARMATLSSTITAGFEMRTEDCIVVFRPKDRLKDFFLKLPEGQGYPPDAKPVATEPMTEDDFQQELISAESRFDNREEIILFSAEKDRGVLVVGRFAGKWFSALRLNVGKVSLQERLDSEQRAFKDRFPAITSAHKRATEWLKKELKDLAKGFEEPMLKIVESHRERVE